MTKYPSNLVGRDRLKDVKVRNFNRATHIVKGVACPERGGSP